MYVGFEAQIMSYIIENPEVTEIKIQIGINGFANSFE